MLRHVVIAGVSLIMSILFVVFIKDRLEHHELEGVPAAGRNDLTDPHTILIARDGEDVTYLRASIFPGSPPAFRYRESFILCRMFRQAPVLSLDPPTVPCLSSCTIPRF